MLVSHKVTEVQESLEEHSDSSARVRGVPHAETLLSTSTPQQSKTQSKKQQRLHGAGRVVFVFSLWGELSYAEAIGKSGEKDYVEA